MPTPRSLPLCVSWLVCTQLFALETDFAAAPDVFPPDRFNAGIHPCNCC